MIKAILFDFDDTLIQTDLVIRKYIFRIIDGLIKDLNADAEEFRQYFFKVHLDAHRKLAVNPVTEWPYIFELLREKYEISSSLEKKYTKIAFKIYESTPKKQKYTLYVLKTVRKMGIKIGLVTHASPEWTEKKLLASGLKKYFDLVKAVSVDEHKSSKHWEQAVKEIGVPKKEIAIVGDSIKGDIIPGTEINVGKVIWFNNPDSWKEYRQGEISNKVIVITNIKEVLDHLD